VFVDIALIQMCSVFVEMGNKVEELECLYISETDMGRTFLCRVSKRKM
jgi:hypothetical protein